MATTASKVAATKAAAKKRTTTKVEPEALKGVTDLEEVAKLKAAQHSEAAAKPETRAEAKPKATPKPKVEKEAYKFTTLDQAILDDVPSAQIMKHFNVTMREHRVRQVVLGKMDEAIKAEKPQALYWKNRVDAYRESGEYADYTAAPNTKKAAPKKATVKRAAAKKSA